MSRVLVVTVEPPWPAQHGGRLRVARVVETLARYLDVLVTFPDHGSRAASPDVPCRPMPWVPTSMLRTRVSVRPHLGGHYLRPVLPALTGLYQEFRPDVLYWSHSYLAAWAPRELGKIRSIVEFANIEKQRLGTLATSAHGLRRAARLLEASKAGIWEPRVSRAAAICVALSAADARTLRGWGAQVVLAPNGVDTLPYQLSPVDGYALAMASYDYEPNIAAVRILVRDVWPFVRQELPTARLVVAGRGSESLRHELVGVDGIQVVGTVDDVSAVYAGAAVALAPATTGGGSQLKLTESVSRGRCVVMTPFAAAGLPAPLRDSGACRTAEFGPAFAAAIVTTLRDVDRRHADERTGWQVCQSLSWDSTVRPVVDAVSRLASPRARR